jgi:hypothetical protein
MILSNTKFALPSQHLFVLWIRGVQAFIVQKGGSPLAFYRELSDATSVARVTCLVIQSVLGDLVIVSSLLLPVLLFY